jgi:hypothetical protein
MNQRRRARRHDQACIRGACESGYSADRRSDFYRRRRIRLLRLYWERPRDHAAECGQQLRRPMVSVISPPCELRKANDHAIHRASVRNVSVVAEEITLRPLGAKFASAKIVGSPLYVAIGSIQLTAGWRNRALAPLLCVRCPVSLCATRRVRQIDRWLKLHMHVERLRLEPMWQARTAPDRDRLRGWAYRWGIGAGRCLAGR